MPIRETVGPSTFWRDFISGLAGPSGRSRQSDVVQTAFYSANDDLIARVAARCVPASDGEGLNLKVRLLASVLDSVRSRTAAADWAGALDAYNLARDLARQEAMESISFVRLGELIAELAEAGDP